VLTRGPRFDELADEELMLRYARGEEQAFEVLLSRYQRPLFGFLFRLLGRQDKAEDVFQDTFFEIIRARKRFKPKLKFSPWLFRIARNRAVDRLRRDGFREMESLDEPLDWRSGEGETVVTNVPSPEPNPEELAQSLEINLALEAALTALPLKQREVFWLKENSGLTTAEIAKVTGVSENTVKSRLRYALEKIKADLSARGLIP